MLLIIFKPTASTVYNLPLLLLSSLSGLIVFQGLAKMNGPFSAPDLFIMIVAEESLLAKPWRHEREPEYRMWSWRGRHAREHVCSQAPCRRHPRWRMDKLAAPAVAPGDRRLVSPRRSFRRAWVETAGGQTERINTVLLDLDGTLYVGARP